MIRICARSLLWEQAFIKALYFACFSKPSRGFIHNELSMYADNLMIIANFLGELLLKYEAWDRESKCLYMNKLQLDKASHTCNRSQ